MKVTENRVAYVSCALIVSVFIECFSWFPSIPSLLKFKSKVPTLTNRVAGVSCVLIVSVFIECFFTGFPETMSDPTKPLSSRTYKDIAVESLTFSLHVFLYIHFSCFFLLFFSQSVKVGW